MSNEPIHEDGNHRIEGGGASHLSKWFFYMVVGWWLMVGLVMVLAAYDDTLLENERMLKRPDALFGFGTKNVMLLSGGFHMILGGILFAIRDTFTKVLLLLWGCSVCAIYRLGFSWLGPTWMKPGEPCPVSRLTADKFGINPKVFGFWWGLILGAFVLGALLVMLLERRQRKRQEEAEFMENWRKTHKDGSPFPWAG